MQKLKSLGAFSSVALSLAAASVIALPIFNSDGTDILSIAMATVVSAVSITLGFVLIPKLIFTEKAVITPLKKTIILLSNLAAGLFMALFTAVTLKEFSEFTVAEVLPEAPLWSVAAFFITVALILTKGGVSVVEKTAVIFFVLGAVLTLVIFLFSLPKMDTKYIMPSGAPNIAVVAVNGLKTALRISVAAIVSVALIFGKDVNVRPVFFGSIVGGVFILLFTLGTLLIFGGGFASTLRYPYVAAVSTAAMGDIFSGLEGFLYVSVFLFSVFKIFILISGIKMVAANIGSLKK